MVLLLIALFIGLPVLEIWLLIEVGGTFGLLPTMALCVGTGVAGAWLARAQGGHALEQVQQRIARGELPTRELVDALMIVVAGVLLMTPGFVTDGAGVLLLLPPVRAWVRRWGLLVLARRAMTAQRGAQGFTFRQGGFEQGPFTRPAEPPDRRPQPEVEFLPPGEAPRAPGRPRPRVIDVE